MTAALLCAAVGVVVLVRQRPQPRAPPPEPAARAIVTYLASTELQGRAAGSAGEAKAAAFIERQLLALGFAPVRGSGRQPVAYERDGGVVRSAGNVVFALDAGAPRTLLLGAHYDHLGLGGPLSREILTEAVHPGADDNASGVALLLRLAWRAVSQPKPRRLNLVVVAFGAEEEGLHGSAALLDEGWVEPSSLVAALNFDMVGRLDTTSPVLALEGVQERPAWKGVLAALPTPRFTVRTENRITPGGSDHCTFAAAGVPVLGLTTGQTDEYHRPSDEPERLNWEGLAEIEQYAGALVDAIDATTVDLAVVVDGGAPRPQGDDAR